MIPDNFRTSFSPWMNEISNQMQAAGWDVFDAASLVSRTSTEYDILVFYILSAPAYEHVVQWRSSILNVSLTGRISRAVWVLVQEDILYRQEKYVLHKASSWFDAVLARYPEAAFNVLHGHYGLRTRRPMFLFPHAAHHLFARNSTALDAKRNQALLSGNIQDCYPLRKAALALLQSGVVTRRTVSPQNMRHGTFDPQSQAREYANEIGLYRIAIAGVVHQNRALWMIAKHFEIMAAGTAMVTDAVASHYLGQLGLFPGVHYLQDRSTFIGTLPSPPCLGTSPRPMLS